MPCVSSLWKGILSCLCCCIASSLLAQGDLFFSEYVEGSSNNKCIELFNPTDADIVLDGVYRIRIYFGGNAEGRTMRNLTGTIPAKQTYLLCNGATATNDLDDIPTDASFAAGHSGDDALVLEKNQIAIDIFGSIGCDPGERWTTDGISTQDITLVRKSCIQQGVAINPSNCEFPTLSEEWIAYPKDDFSHLNNHLFEEIEATTQVIDEACKDNNTGQITITPQTGIYPYEYSIDQTDFQVDSIFNNLSDGSYQILVRDQQGCEFAETVTLQEGIILTVAIEASAMKICENETLTLSVPTTYSSYQWSNTISTPQNTITQPGTYSIEVSNEKGCTATDQVEIDWIPQDTIREFFTTCNPDQVGVQTIAERKADGCSDIIITTLTLVEKDTTYLTETTCDSQLAGQEEDLFQNQFGCDSLVITTISLLASDTTYQTIKKCEVSTIGMDTLFLTNSNGCDSLLITETILEDRRDIERLTASTCIIAQV